ncbi:MAG TPA: hypothetical protein ENJ54_08225 [Chloroflexi bacterium]|nr:hypothetical protein [Chloroflexota bacterium]
MEKMRLPWQQFPLRRGQMFGLLILTALVFFEVFNFSTTEFALHDLLGEMRFAGLHWATILAIAFCGIDFAGIARLFTPEEADAPTMEVWYLFGAWLLAATMNAMLTWWGVSIAILSHSSAGREVLGQQTLLKAVPVFVAVLVWLVRVLIIGTISTAGPRLFSQRDEAGVGVPRRTSVAARSAVAAARRTTANRRQPSVPSRATPSPEPTYEPLYSAAPTHSGPRQV